VFSLPVPRPCADKPVPDLRLTISALSGLLVRLRAAVR